jgi:SAM-dependent methyltransferase
MRTERAGVVARGLGKVRSWSIRAKERALGQPIVETHNSLPLPPPHLRHAVANSEDVAWFLQAGAEGAACLREVLEKSGIVFNDLGAVLDFGCGVGRVLRHLADPTGPALHGTDFNREMIAWCAASLPFALFQVNDLKGPLAFENESFELIYAFSVFTHLAEPSQIAWIEELRRVLRPGGHLVLTLHGEHYLPQLSAADQRRFLSGQLVVVGRRREGRNDCAAFHPEAYVRQTLARGLDVVDFLPRAARGNPWQDVYLLRKGEIPGARGSGFTTKAQRTQREI